MNGKLQYTNTKHIRLTYIFSFNYMYITWPFFIMITFTNLKSVVSDQNYKCFS